ncbi:MAG: hypothetical protein WBA97_35355 [Actinophytocola sp.]|uniref:hypothetical protein n=1 Tax=Actinophytocola sp. TaxID=1872138 RepID=UPI003C779634
MTTPDRRWPVWPWLVLTVAGIAVTVVAAIVGTAASTNEAEDTPPGTVTVTASQDRKVPERVTVTVAPPPEVPATALLDGLHTVGRDVQPGIYQTTGPSGTNEGGCYWTRSDSGGGIIENGVIIGPGTLTVNLNELVETAGCQPWQKVG